MCSFLIGRVRGHHKGLCQRSCHRSRTDTHVIMCGGSEDHVKCHSQSAVCIVVTANQRVASTSICKRDLALPPVNTGPDLCSQGCVVGNSVTHVIIAPTPFNSSDFQPPLPPPLPFITRDTRPSSTCTMPAATRAVI